MVLPRQQPACAPHSAQFNPLLLSFVPAAMLLPPYRLCLLRPLLLYLLLLPPPHRHCCDCRPLTSLLPSLPCPFPREACRLIMSCLCQQ